MVKRRGRPRSAYFSDNSPEFFKFYNPDKSSKLLHVPPAFVKHFDGTIPDTAILKDQNEKFWHVEVKRVDNGLFFKSGWENFVKNHSLALGDFLIFKYNGISLFNVRIFGKNGCEKEDSFTIEKTIARVKIEEDPEPEQTFPRTTYSFKRKSAKSKRNCPLEVTPLRSQRIAPKVFKECGTPDAKLMPPHGSQRIAPKVFEERRTPDSEPLTPHRSLKIVPQVFEECGTPDAELTAPLISQRIAPQVLEECGVPDLELMAPLTSQSFAPKVFEKCGTPDAAQMTPRTNPYFIASLVRGRLSTLSIPRGWVKRNGIKLRPDMKFCDQSGKSWPVKLRFQNDGRMAFGDGWMEFQRDKNTGSHDRCKFEFVVGRGGRISKTILVHILRAEAAPNHKYWTRRRPQFEG